MKRTITCIQNEIIRTKSNLQAINRHPFTAEDREILEPKYKNDLVRLEKEVKIFQTEVNQPETLKV